MSNLNLSIDYDIVTPRANFKINLHDIKHDSSIRLKKFRTDFSIIEEMISTAAEGILQATQSSESPGKKGHRRKSGIIAKKVSEGKQKKQRTMSTSYAQHMQIRRGSLMPPDLSMLDDINETEDGESSKETGTEEVGRKADPDTPNAGASTGVKHTIGDAVLAGEVLSDKTKLNVFIYIIITQKWFD